MICWGRFLRGFVSGNDDGVQVTVYRRILKPEDLRRYPLSSIGDIHHRIGGEIHIRQIKRVLDGLIAQGEVSFTGERRWRRYRVEP
ncbi:hypothetical protein CBM2634_A10105 [Cupriavidus taiwanensis]|uniref:Uncharacterized protein n=1 Tax=Cupriavidus taiwanensis TaxID=164546 RepID=A0A375IV26_9BURK|nr:hypothetical protein CBM2634_A10105 [Cupriavidus taiwanensis]